MPKSSHMPGPVAVLDPCHGSLQVAGRPISGCLSAQCGPARGSFQVLASRFASASSVTGALVDLLQPTSESVSSLVPGHCQ